MSARHIASALVLGLALAGCGGDDGVDLSDVETSPNIDVIGTEMAFDPELVAVEAGQVEVILRNEGQVLHDIRIEQQPFVVEADPGETATGTVQLEAGSYEFFCSIPGHREAGMEGFLEVR